MNTPFDPELEPLAWFDPDLVPLRWFDLDADFGLIVLFPGTPSDDRVYVVAHELRALEVDSEPRFYVVEADPRRSDEPREPRTDVVEWQDRGTSPRE